MKRKKNTVQLLLFVYSINEHEIYIPRSSFRWCIHYYLLLRLRLLDVCRFSVSNVFISFIIFVFRFRLKAHMFARLASSRLASPQPKSFEMDGTNGAKDDEERKQKRNENQRVFWTKTMAKTREAKRYFALNERDDKKTKENYDIFYMRFDLILLLMLLLVQFAICESGKTLRQTAIVLEKIERTRTCKWCRKCLQWTISTLNNISCCYTSNDNANKRATNEQGEIGESERDGEKRRTRQKMVPGQFERMKLDFMSKPWQRQRETSSFFRDLSFRTHNTPD